MGHNIVIQQEVDDCLHHIDESKKEQFLKVIQETQIILDEPVYDDSIDGASIRGMYMVTITRKGKEPLKFQYISETSIDFNKTPIDYEQSDAIMESYNVLERDKPTLYRILGLLKRNYFLPQDFSYKVAIEYINKLRQIFSKDEILVFPSIDKSAINIGLIPIWLLLENCSSILFINQKFRLVTKSGICLDLDLTPVEIHLFLSLFLASLLMLLA